MTENVPVIIRNELTRHRHVHHEYTVTIVDSVLSTHASLLVIR